LFLVVDVFSSENQAEFSSQGTEGRSRRSFHCKCRQIAHQEGKKMFPPFLLRFLNNFVQGTMWTAELRGRMQDIMQSNAAVFRTGSVLKVRKNFFDFGVVFSSDLFFFLFSGGSRKDRQTVSSVERRCR
jgi:hypothetical protein